MPPWMIIAILKGWWQVSTHESFCFLELIRPARSHNRLHVIYHCMRSVMKLPSGSNTLVVGCNVCISFELAHLFDQVGAKVAPCSLVVAQE